MSAKERKRAAANRERRERKRELPRRRREWLDEQRNSPPFAELLAGLGSSVEGLRKLTEKPEAPEWGARGPRPDPVRDIFHSMAALVVRSARAAGWPYNDAIALGVGELRRLKVNGCSPKTVEAILANPNLPKMDMLLTPEQVEHLAWVYGINTTKDSTTMY